MAKTLPDWFYARRGVFPAFGLDQARMQYYDEITIPANDADLTYIVIPSGFTYITGSVKVATEDTGRFELYVCAYNIQTDELEILDGDEGYQRLFLDYRFGLPVPSGYAIAVVVYNQVDYQRTFKITIHGLLQLEK